MTDEAHAETQPLPYGATEIHLGSQEYSEELATRLLESGASDAAIDAAGGPGTARRLHAADAANARRSSRDSLAPAGA
jgi:hypothetical protein